MNYCLIAAALIIFTAVLDGISLRRRIAKDLYDPKNIMMAAAWPSAAVAAVIFIVEGLTGNFHTSEIPASGEAADGAVSSAHLLLDAIRCCPRELARITVIFFVIMLILMAVSNVSLIKHEGMSPRNALGTAMLGMYTLATVVAFAAADFVSVRVFPEGSSAPWLGRFLPLFFFCLVDHAEQFTLGIMFLGVAAAKQKPAYDKDFIIIPGCLISKNGGLLPLLRGRVNRAIRYAWDQEIASGRPVCYVPSGGQGADEIMSEGSAMELYLLSHAAEENEVFPEKKSKNTYENFAFSKQIIESINPEANVAFATTNYHMLRCGMIARSLGMHAEGIASDTKWYFWPNGFAREVAAVVEMTKREHVAATVVIACVCAVLASL